MYLLAIGLLPKTTWSQGYHPYSHKIIFAFYNQAHSTPTCAPTIYVLSFEQGFLSIAASDF